MSDNGAGNLDEARFFQRERAGEAMPEEARQAALAAAWQQVAEHPAGEIVLHDLFRLTGLLRTAVVPGDPYLTHVELGRREIGLLVLDRLRWSPTEVAALATRQTEDFLRGYGARAGRELTPDEEVAALREER